ncbi:hypothetical protein [Flaviaesturariibacter amylovorans]|uniref:DUF805 domain-containing protein n=1 Tax=Flaviaesturariibacter amylovorans TaxID=1084520 RepID=A0ABP8G9E5_9BACT
MIERIQRHLLTHHPLLWNTRALWVLGTNILLHLLFLLAGLGSVQPARLGDERGSAAIGTGGLVTFSILCSLLVLLVWLLFYFRNNAFRNGYRLTPGYLLREWGLIVLIVFTSLIYHESFLLGKRLRVRQFTNTERFVQEVNAAALAMAFVPDEEDDPAYFVLNNCAENGGILYNNSTNYQELADSHRNDTSVAGRQIYQESLTILRALQQPDAFSYRHYCGMPISYAWDYPGMTGADEHHARRIRWIEAGSRDSIRASLDALVNLCNRYGIRSRIHTDSLAAAVFRLPGNALWKYTPTDRFVYHEGVQQENASYLLTDDLRGVFSFIDDCLPNRRNRQDHAERLLAMGYTAFGLALLLWAWRRFSRKVFLVTLVGVLLWSILIGLMSIGSGDGSGPSVIILCLFVAFGLLGLFFLRSRENKTATGVLLLWHFLLSAAVIPLILFLCNQSYDRLRWSYNNNELWERIAQQRHPVLYWIEGHTGTLLALNFALVLLYIGLAGNRSARSWQPMPEE